MSEMAAIVERRPAAVDASSPLPLDFADRFIPYALLGSNLMAPQTGKASWFTRFAKVTARGGRRTGDVRRSAGNHRRLGAARPDLRLQRFLATGH